MKNVKDYLKLNYDISKPIKKWYGDFKITWVSFYYHSGNKFSEEILIGLPKEITGDFYFWIGSEASSELISDVTELIKKTCKVYGKIRVIKTQQISAAYL
jgi:hypothetical protein